jgi:hypothetical protein
VERKFGDLDLQLTFGALEPVQACLAEVKDGLSIRLAAPSFWQQPGRTFKLHLLSHESCDQQVPAARML